MDGPHRPNLTWCFGDQYQYGGQALSCMGDANVSTPNFDRLAIQGLHCVPMLAGWIERTGDQFTLPEL